MKLRPFIYFATTTAVAFTLAACSSPAPAQAPQPSHASASTAAAVEKFSHDLQDGTLNHRGWALKTAGPKSATTTLKNLDATPKILSTETVTCSKFDVFYELPVEQATPEIAISGSETRSYFVVTATRSDGTPPSYEFFDANSGFCG